MDQEELNRTRLGFVDITVFNDDSIRGGLLITDLETKPYEFRATSPINPTAFQKILYGSTLKEYIYADLICAPLIDAANEKPELILVRSDNLLRIRSVVPAPVILLQIISAENTKSGKPGLRFVTHDRFPDDKEWAESLLKPIASLLMEPFERVRLALEEVNRQRPESR